MDRITPFSNGTEFMGWQDNNCMQCSQYESTSRIRGNAKCKLAFDIDYATVGDGTIPLSTAKWIGYSNDELKWNCNMKNIIFSSVKFNSEVFKQLKLF